MKYIKDWLHLSSVPSLFPNELRSRGRSLVRIQVVSQVGCKDKVSAVANVVAYMADNLQVGDSLYGITII